MQIETTSHGGTAADVRLPVYYLPHGGGPCFFMEDQRGPPDMWKSMAAFLESVIPSLPRRPKALLIISGHWDEPQVTVNAGEKPALLYDYYGFPEHTYRLRWDAPGAPDVAARVKALLDAAGFPTAMETQRGWDHGVFIPMKVALPDADIPTVQLSLRSDYDAAAHIALGKALAPLRDEGVLILGSGMSFHNLRAPRDGSATPLSQRFDNWLTRAVTDPDPAQRNQLLAHWENGDHARFAHPREDHLLPLMVAAGAAGEDPGVRVYNGVVIGWAVSGYRFG